MTADRRTDPTRRTRAVRRSALIALTAALAAPAAAATTPKEAYQIDLTCAALLRTGVPTSQASAEHLVPVAELYARRVQSSGRAIGKTPEGIGREVDAARAAALDRIAPTVGAKAAAERADIAKTEQECVALPVFEVIGRRAPTAKS